MKSQHLSDLRYAALELRLCMEALTYNKLKGTGKHIPAQVLDKWQPPQAIKALLELEPSADKGFSLYFGREDEYGVPPGQLQYLGDHKPLKLGWLKKHYHKIGALLHRPSANSTLAKDVKSFRSYLEGVLAELEDAASGTITGGAFIEPFKFDCEKCGDPIIVAKHTIQNTPHIVCLNANCRAEYFGELNENGSATFALKVTNFDCISCGAKVRVENRHLVIGYRFKCKECNAEHGIAQRQWGYGLVDSTERTENE